jgi:hypothetical protein
MLDGTGRINWVHVHAIHRAITTHLIPRGWTSPKNATGEVSKGYDTACISSSTTVTSDVSTFFLSPESS